MHFLKRYPITTAGLITALLALGEAVRPYGGWIRLVLGSAALVLYLIYLAKLMLTRAELKEAWEDSITVSRLSYVSIAAAFLAGYAAQCSDTAGAVIWYAGLAVHALLILWFSYKFVLRGFSIRKVYPSWFTVYVGIAAASITASLTGQPLAGRIVFWFALSAFAVLLPLVCWRTCFIKPIPDAAKTTIVTFALPASLLLAGYIGSFDVRSPLMTNGLTMLSAIMYLIGLCYYIYFLWKSPGFTLEHADFAFPIAAGALASRMLADASKIGLVTITMLAGLETILASLVVADVLVHYLVFLFFILKKAQRHNNR